MLTTRHIGASKLLRAPIECAATSGHLNCEDHASNIMNLKTLTTSLVLLGPASFFAQLVLSAWIPRPLYRVIRSLLPLKYELPTQL